MDFEEAIFKSEELLDEIEKLGINEARANQITGFLGEPQSARGFFVNYLTGSYKMSEQPPVRLIELLRTGGDHLSDLLVKNLVMSTTMKVVHDREGSQADSEGSQTVASRTCNLILLVRDPRIKTNLEAMKQALDSAQGNYGEFVGRFKYDEEQKSAAVRSIDLLLARW